MPRGLRVLRVVHDPTSNTTLSLLLLAAVVLVVLLLVSLVMALAMPSSKRVVKVRRYSGTPEEIAAVRARAEARKSQGAAVGPAARSPRRLMSTPILIAFAVLLVVSAYAVTSTDAYCARTCHRSSEGADTALAVDHASCTSCHEGHVVTGAVGNGLSRLRMLAMQTVSEAPTSSAVPVESSACLHCHRSIRRGVVVSSSGTRMSHAEVIAAGEACTSCHVAMGHREQAYTKSMSGCVTCHDTRTASATCTTCHSTDPLAARVDTESTATVGSGDIVYPAVRAANRDCAGCHNVVKDCDPCHGGIRMPHSPEFKAGGHAVNAAFERKTACWRCHDPQVCAADCHTSFSADGASSHGKPAKWRLEHQASSWTAGCGCHAGRSQRDYPICYRCHDRSTKQVLPSQP